MRSVMLPGSNICFDMRRKDLNYDMIRREVGLWRQYRPELLRRLLSADALQLGQIDLDRLAVRPPESGEGMMQAFRRAESPYESIHVKLHGLDPDAVYTMTNVDVADTTEATGRELMEKGIRIAIEKQPGAVVILYKKKN